MGEKIKQAQSTLNQFKQQMKEFEKAIKNGEDPNQQMINKAKSKEDSRLANIIKGSKDDSNTTH